MRSINNPFGDPKYQPDEPERPEGLPEDVIVSPDTQRGKRLPLGQSRIRRWPVLDAFGAPQIDLAKWKLEVNGLVDSTGSLSWEEFKKLPRVKVFADMHCVTRWSRLGNHWEGVATREISRIFGVQPEAQFVICHAYDYGWTTNLPIEHFLAEDSLLADTHDGEPIPIEHGGPLRLIIPRLYAWKSAKWIRGIEFVKTDRAGYWEDGGYHMVGDPWSEQRFR